MVCRCQDSGMFINRTVFEFQQRQWVRSVEEIPKEDYMKYFYEFDPKVMIQEMGRKLAKEAGMKCVVLTAKHHDGFCLFDE